MRYLVEIVRAVTAPLMLEAKSKSKARALVARHVLSVPSVLPEVTGDTAPEPPQIPTALKLGD